MNKCLLKYVDSHSLALILYIYYSLRLASSHPELLNHMTIIVHCWKDPYRQRFLLPME